jgi:hypothetical protein
MEFKVTVDSSVFELADAIKRLGDLVPPSLFEEKEKAVDEISEVFLRLIQR